MSCTLKDAVILFYNGRITQVKDLLPLLENLSTQSKSLLIVAEDIDGEEERPTVDGSRKLEGLLNHKVTEKECNAKHQHCESMAGLRKKLYELNQEIQRKRYPVGEGTGIRKTSGLR